jgi:hypothetical protein
MDVRMYEQLGLARRVAGLPCHALVPLAAPRNFTGCNFPRIPPHMQQMPYFKTKIDSVCLPF